MAQRSASERTPGSIPPDPYPPKILPKYPSTQFSSLRSSLKSSPQYSKESLDTLSSTTTTTHYHHPTTVFPTTAHENQKQTIMPEDRRRIVDSEARIEFCQFDLLACINTNGTSWDTTRSNRQQGPVLLELKQLLVEDGRSFTTNPVCLSRSNPSLGTSLLSTCLSVAPASAIPSYRDPTVPSPCVTGLSTGALCLHTFQVENANNTLDLSSNHTTSSSSYGAVVPVMEYYQTPSRQHRPATAVAWRPTVHNAHVAIGMVATFPGASGGGVSSGGVVGSGGGVAMGGGGGVVASGLPQGTSRRAISAGGVGVASASPTSTSGRGGSTGDRDYCCFLWDCEHQSMRRTKSAPLYKLSHQIGVASLGWLMDGTLLALGGQVRNLQIYDIRGPQQAPISVYAHNFAVHVAVDPSRTWQLATFCKAASEPVKIWDCRRMDSAVSEIKIGGGGDLLSFVSAVQWSPLESGRLALSVGNTIQEYDTTTTGSRPVPVHTLHAKDSILDFCLYPYGNTTNNSSAQNDSRPLDERILREFFPKRLMAVSSDRTVTNMARHSFAPVAISRRDGRIVHAFGRSLWIGSTSDGPAAMERRRCSSSSGAGVQEGEVYDYDISAIMLRRAACHHVTRYGMDPSSNIYVLAEEEGGPEKNDSHVSSEAILRLWRWVERVEDFCAEAEDVGENSMGVYWPAKGLMDAGVCRLLAIDQGPDVEVFSDTFFCTTYDSPGRRAALMSCGWAGKFSLVHVLKESEEMGEFERSAALAVWHGDIGAAVNALERGASFIRGQLSEEQERQKRDGRISSQYAESLELVSLCIAGYRAGDDGSSSSSVWRRACANLIQRADSAASHTTARLTYIRVLLRFLMSLGTSSGYQKVLDDWSLSLGDRVAFACRFLPRDELKRFVENSVATCQTSGKIEGLIVTGVEKEGIKILQSFVDHTTDVQTAALLTSRVILPHEWSWERSICLEWLDSYRSLLNTWQMWQSRAMFDVDRADLLRRVKGRMGGSSSFTTTLGVQLKTPAPVGFAQARSRSGITGRSKSPGNRQPDPDVQASVPAQLDARCNYCAAPLGLKNQDTHTSQFLSKMKPVLSCCPQCRKPLPRCAICLLSLGTLNPYMELLTKDNRQHSGNKLCIGTSSASSTPTTTNVNDLSSLASLPFAEWFTWCMRCKHGGHAHHWVGWFAKHEVCPVSGCDCKCQFDGIQKLNRPALLFQEQQQQQQQRHRSQVDNSGNTSKLE